MKKILVVLDKEKEKNGFYCEDENSSVKLGSFFLDENLEQEMADSFQTEGAAFLSSLDTGEENVMNRMVKEITFSYDVSRQQDDGSFVVATDRLIEEVITKAHDASRIPEQKLRREKKEDAVFYFLHGLARMILSGCLSSYVKCRTIHVHLTGSAFNNSYLKEMCIRQLEQNGFEID